MKKIESLLITLAAAMALAACSSTPTQDAGAASTAAPAPSAAPASPAAPATAPSPANPLVTMPLHKDPNSALAKQRSVYFDFDDATVKSEFNGLIETHGKYLQGNPRLAVRIEGHADERGSAEYNLALGQKRAEAVVRALKIIGVKDSQMEPISYGEERPVAAGQGESAWGRNRRADVVYRD